MCDVSKWQTQAIWPVLLGLVLWLVDDTRTSQVHVIHLLHQPHNGLSRMQRTAHSAHPIIADDLQDISDGHRSGSMLSRAYTVHALPAMFHPDPASRDCKTMAVTTDTWPARSEKRSAGYQGLHHCDGTRRGGNKSDNKSRLWISTRSNVLG
jgi:hypothetical protein